MSRAAQRGQPDEQVGNEEFGVYEEILVWGENSGDPGTVYTNLGSIVNFPPNAVIHLSTCTLWVIGTAEQAGDYFEYLGVVPADEAEATLTKGEFFSRLLNFEMKSVVFGDGTGMFIEKANPIQLYLDETFSTDVYSKQGIFIFAYHNSAGGVALQCVSRIHGEAYWMQRYFSDTYIRKGARITEGWAGYDWEESFSEDET